MLVTAFYKNDSSVEMMDYEISPLQLSAGDKSVIISFRGCTAEVEISVYPILLDRIELTKRPHLTEYKIGEEFNPEGMEITAFYNNGRSDIVNIYDCTITPQVFYETGNNIFVTVSYSELEIYIPVTVLKASEIIKGDVNGDNVIDIIDAIEIFRHLAGKTILEGDKFTAADADENGIIDIKDVIYIFRYLAGKL